MVVVVVTWLKTQSLTTGTSFSSSVPLIRVWYFCLETFLPIYVCVYATAMVHLTIVSQWCNCCMSWFNHLFVPLVCCLSILVDIGYTHTHIHNEHKALVLTAALHTIYSAVYSMSLHWALTMGTKALRIANRRRWNKKTVDSKRKVSKRKKKKKTWLRRRANKKLNALRRLCRIYTHSNDMTAKEKKVREKKKRWQHKNYAFRYANAGE